VIRVVFLSQIAATLAMVGITWFAQVVHYPLFRRVGEDAFSDYEALNMRLTTWVVGPLILVEGATALVLVWLRPEGVLLSQPLIGVGLLVLIWLSTVFLQVPMHKILARGYDPAAHRRLVMSNWIRTMAWSARGLLVLWMVARAM
jgi:hypothetical protein